MNKQCFQPPISDGVELLLQRERAVSGQSQLRYSLYQYQPAMPQMTDYIQELRCKNELVTGEVKCWAHLHFDIISNYTACFSCRMSRGQGICSCQLPAILSKSISFTPAFRVTVKSTGMTAAVHHQISNYIDCDLKIYSTNKTDCWRSMSDKYRGSMKPYLWYHKYR